MERPAVAFAEKWAAFARTLGPQSRLRMAPTPSGFLHVGNAVNFTLNWLAARLHPQGRLLLRIDDLDAERKRPEYVQNIFDTLHWLGLDWDEGPRSPEDLERQWSQRHRLPLYETLLRTLRERQYLFACAKSRRDLAPFGSHYPEAFRQQPCSLDDADVAWRIRTPLPHRPEHMPPDFVVRRRDGIPAYQVVSVADDVFFGITHVIRGEDLSASTHAQEYLARCAELPAFERIVFLHHPLLTDAQGNKLSKSAGAQALHAQQARSTVSPADVFGLVGRWLALEEPVSTAAALLSAARQKAWVRL
ncbi:MAG: glutamate--tRNA ligase family protein [Saprospiraceae bacterium]|nr:glutamate--tRNA ligase family protein [Saprospiraceae bacterium]MDW8229059.1 glutamate--tRNA ligase family protein [Saprospiraceae bacterium]